MFINFGKALHLIIFSIFAAILLAGLYYGIFKTPVLTPIVTLFGVSNFWFFAGKHYAAIDGFEPNDATSWHLLLVSSPILFLGFWLAFIALGFVPNLSDAFNFRSSFGLLNALEWHSFLGLFFELAIFVAMNSVTLFYTFQRHIKRLRAKRFTP